MGAVYCIDLWCKIVHYKRMRFEIIKTANYSAWFKNQPGKFQAQVAKRLSNIEEHGHFEIKFNNGSRIYFIRTKANQLTLLLGGNKNGQSKDIAKAKTFLD
jgi:putative addiction module killer protein